MTQRITILGDGAMATVCSILLTQRGHSVTIWGALEDSIEQLLQTRQNPQRLPGVRIPPSVRLTTNEDDCFAGCTMIVNAIPTQFMRGAWQRVGHHIPPAVPIVSVTKGIENHTLLRPTQIIADVLGGKKTLLHGTLCDHPLAVLSGPNIAAELARYLPATSVAAADDPKLAQLVQATFSAEWFRVYTNADLLGVELAGATKNVIAIAAGILDGLGAGSNAKAALVTRGLVEITRLAVTMGAREDTFSGLAGLGDLITTCISPEGRNRHVGEQIGKGRTLEEVLSEMSSIAEGVSTTRAVHELARRHQVEMPITAAVHAVLFENKEVIAALTELMSRDPKPEHTPTP